LLGDDGRERATRDVQGASPDLVRRRRAAPVGELAHQDGVDLAELLGLGGVHVGFLLGGSGGSGLGAVEDLLGAREDAGDLRDSVGAGTLLAARLRVVHAAAALETAGEDAGAGEVAVDAEAVPGQPLRALARLGVAGDLPG